MRVDPPRPDDAPSLSPNLAQPHAEPPVAEPEAPRPAAAASWVPAPAAPILASTNGFEPPASSAANGASAATLLTPAPGGGGDGYRPTCTVAQLRRFIKSRPWIPLHELRRRFGIYGGDDDVSPMRVGDHTLFIGLPPAESRLIAELLTGGDVGYELSLDPGAPIVVGVYPMRPVPRG
jgi:hypothetical protein